MSKIAVIYGYPMASKYGKYRFELNTGILDLLPENEYYFLALRSKTRVLKAMLNQKRYKEIIDLSKFLKTTSWKEAYAMIDRLIEKYHFEKIFLFLPPIPEGFHFGNEKNVVKIYEKSREIDDYGMAMNFCDVVNKKTMLSYYMNHIRGIPMTHFVDDPLEPHYKKLNDNNEKDHRFFTYFSKMAEADYFPYIFYAMIHKRNLIEGPFDYSKKTYDLVLGMTSVMKVSDFRYQMVSFILENEEKFKAEGLNCKFFLKDSKRKIDTLIPGEKYNDVFVAGSKFTLVVPAYKKDEFSMVRFIEAMDRKCIPLIHDSCPWEPAFACFPTIKAIIVKYGLTWNMENLITKLKTLDFETISKELMECRDYKMLREQKFYEFFIAKNKQFLT